MTEDEELMAKISQLAGQINRHKNQAPQAPTHPPSELHAAPYVSRHTRARAGWAPYRGRPYGRGHPAAPHRHRTLVLNNANSGNPASSTPGQMNENVGESRSATPNGWVAKRDRHMQLINSAIYDKEAQARAKAMEQTRKAKAEKKTRIEQAKVLRYAQGFGRPHHATSVAPQVSATSQPQGEYQVYLNDIPFRIAKGGSKLIRVSGGSSFCAAAVTRTGLPVVDDPNTANITPKKVTVAGYCDKGAECEERHVHECPDYAATGVCNRKRCRLPHVDRAGQIRKNAASKADPVDEEESDESSEEEEYDAIDSDDVDSDDLEDEPEYVEGADTGEHELLQQHDFIRF
ncbi:hypothetical protein CNMCM5793_008146 [Aspergillus hiratsukae]|uniref:C3H1-type domain-containing protein n=1 Tax=Aspergillus hiratsukae TaxID=1194566 RepID=A0A8H6P776_9EURO|nr:hypothetical protein CNMCM5793_008146 [Aspergillus hiratsukae]KAF7161443.1 hypothetical protein CNMCM6106_008688 [Aspergillus hiratsukae]